MPSRLLSSITDGLRLTAAGPYKIAKGVAIALHVSRQREAARVIAHCHHLMADGTQELEFERRLDSGRHDQIVRDL